MVAKHDKKLLKGHMNALENSLKRIATPATGTKEIGNLGTCMSWEIWLGTRYESYVKK